MSRILCSLSGVEFRVDHFSLYLSAREAHHPIFSLSPDKLLELSEKYLEQEFSDTENYLLYLALFNATGLVEFRVPAVQFVKTDSIVAHNMLNLMTIVSKFNVIGMERIQNQLSLPRFVITPDTKNLSSSKDWILVWENAYKDFKDKYRSSTILDQINNMEKNLERHIKDRTKDISSYAGQLANWAAKAGAFPTWDAGDDIVSITGSRLSLSDYWKYIIKLCAKADPVYSIPDEDIAELIEHCEEHIEQGSIYAFTLMALLRAASEKKTSFFDFGDIDVKSTFQILDSKASVEDANLIAMIDSAPTEKPIEKNYPNKLAFIKARAKWEFKLAYEKDHPKDIVPKDIIIVPTDVKHRRAEDITVETVRIITSEPIPEIGASLNISPLDAAGSF